MEHHPYPLLLLDAREEGWPVVLSNPAFDQRISAIAEPAGRPLRDVVPVDAVLRVDTSENTPPLEEILDAARDSGQAALLDVVLASRPGPAQVPPGIGESRTPTVGSVSWAGRLQPLAKADGEVWGLLLVLRDPTEEGGLSGQPQPLSDLALELAAGTTPEEVYAGALHAAVNTAGATRGAILLSEGDTTFTVVAASPGSGLEERLVLQDLSSPVWQIAFGPRRLRWEAGAGLCLVDAEPGAPEPEPPPLPFATMPGWEQLLMVGIRMRGRQLGVLAVAGPGAGWFDHRALDRLGLVAEFVSIALDNIRLIESFARLEQLLRGAVEASAGLVEATEPSIVRRQFLDALVTEVGLSGAALWRRSEDTDGGVELIDWVGLPEDVRRRVAVLDPTTMVARMATGRLEGQLRHASAAPAHSSWPGRLLRLLPVPEPARGVLGVYVDRPLPDLVDGVLVTLVHAFAAAVHQTTLHKRARTVVNSLQHELRPRTVALPDTVSVGTVYRSATAGVEVGGDFFDVFRTLDGQVGVACGDVSGKGVEAASLTAMAVYSLRAHALRGASPRAVLALVNGSVCAQTSAERFMTLAYLRIDPEGWATQLGLAGHPPPLLVGPAGVEVLHVAPDVPVGIDEHSEFEEIEIRLDQGQSLILYTDGVTEARQHGAPDGALFGMEGLLRAVRELAGDPQAGAQDLASGIYRAVVDWTRDGTSDDCAIVVVRRAAAGEGLGSLGMDTELIP
ncbi:MAG: SpoIIE family protein phosphatase [Nitriliruptorales bacterium]|nr:SpoIIE family protein phosphatase [Nitriliruptorales bacterium]